jgi:hypothetical protein
MPKAASKKKPQKTEETKRPLRKLEIAMLEQGYASAKMVAQKCCVHFATILNYAKAGQLTSITHGSQVFIEIDSVKKMYADMSTTFPDWNDWTFAEGVDKRS